MILKHLICRDAHELGWLFIHDYPELSINRQCVLLGPQQSTLYYRAVQVRLSTQQIMTRIDALYLNYSCRCSRRIFAYLVREGVPTSRDRVRNLMHPWVYGRATMFN